MVIGLIKKALGVSSTPKAEKTVEAETSFVGFVDYVVKQLVDSPDEAVIKTEQKDDVLVIEITCAQADMGKVIGKRGKTIAAIRTLVSSAARREDQKVNVEVLD